MADNIQIVNGKASFARRFGSKAAWHNLGQSVKGNDTHTWAIEANADWDVNPTNGYAITGTNADGSPIYSQIPDMRVYLRSDNNSVLSYVGPNTHPLQNRDAFTFFQPFLDSGAAELDTAMVLDGGRKVVVTARIIGGTTAIGGVDEVERYIILSNCHNGLEAVRVGYTPIRVVCANTLAMAKRDSRSKLIRVSHSKQVTANVTAIRATMDAVNEGFNVTFDQFNALERCRNITQKDLIKFAKIVFKIEENPATLRISKQGQTKLDDILRLYDRNVATVGEMMREMKEREEQERANNAIMGEKLLDTILENMEAGRGADISPASWWTAYNAATEFTTHQQGRSEEGRFLSNLDGGPNSKVNDLALETAMVMSGLQSA